MLSRPALIVLAAGRGSRFLGSHHKLAQALGPSTVLGTTLRHAIETHLPVVVVTTEPLADLARRSVAARDVVVLPEVAGERIDPPPSSSSQLALGMGYSIAAGVSARPDAMGWLILPGDMPIVQAATLRAVAEQLGQHPVVYAQYHGRRGHPVAFASELYSELTGLRGDEGARRLVARYPAFGLEVDDAGVLIDVDTEADLALVRSAHDGAVSAARGA